MARSPAAPAPTYTVRSTTTCGATSLARSFGVAGESRKYLLYAVDTSGSTDTELRARAVAGGSDIPLGTNVGRLSPLAGTNAFVMHAYGARVPGQPSAPATITKIDLDSPATPRLLASDVAPHVVVERTVYVGAGTAGLRALTIP